MEYIRRLTPELFHEAMVAEVADLERCFAHDDATGALVWAPPKSQGGREWDCEDIRRDQLSMLGFQSRRTPGRLLMSLYGAFVAKWLE